MDTNALARSTLADLQDAGVLYLRRQCSIGVLRVNFDRGATRLRLLAPDTASAVRDYVDELDRIVSDEPEPRRFALVGRLLERFDAWVRRPDAPTPPPPRIARQTAPQAAPPPPEVSETPETLETPEPPPPAPPPPPVLLALPAPSDVPPPPPDPADDDPALDPPARAL